MLKILHIAPLNFAGVPYDFYKMHLAAGDLSRLITLHKNPHSFPEDVCLDLFLPNFSLAKLWRSKKAISKRNLSLKKNQYFSPSNKIEKIYFDLSDSLRKNKVERIIQEYDLNSYDIIHFDGGLDFFRNSSQAIKWKKDGKKIVSCFYGSDLRIRGVIKEIDEISDLNLTSEYDHLIIKENLNYIFYPYDIAELPKKVENNSGILKIVHSPTNRLYKGTDLIIEVIDKIKREHRIEFQLLENMPREKVLKIKSESDICIDQVGGKFGGTGYGKSGLETLGMGVPTITNMTDDYKNWLPENPFVVANNYTELYNSLSELITDERLRILKGRNGKDWVVKYHGYESVNKRLKELYTSNNIL